MEELNLPRSESSQPPPSTPSRPSNIPIPSGVFSTPMSFKQSGSGPFTSIEDKHDSRTMHMSNEVVDKIVGPMPVKMFLDEFLPKVSESKPRMSLKLYQEKMEIVSKSQKETEMYTPFIEAIKPLCPDFFIGDTHDLPFTAFRSITIKPDVCFYNLPTPSKDETQNIEKVEMMLELKPHELHDPFSDAADQPLINSSKRAKKTLGQITSYASAHQAAQFRSYVFSLLILPRYARILRWDRSGMIVTEKIPLSSRSLREFFHRYNFMKPEERGNDTTVTMSPSDNKTKNNILSNQLSVNNHLYTVSRQLYMDNNRSPFGRSTRAFIAYSVLHEKNVFVKDTWRLSSQTPEHEIYRKLKENNVQYIANVLDAGDISDQQTRTQDFISQRWAKNPPGKLRKHFHYRLVLNEVGSSLATFSSTKLLVSVVHQALTAHKDAYEKAKILHRDISANNILIHENKALLIDWDLSKNTTDPEAAREAERTGTWQFTSAKLLSSENVQAHTLTDDIESFIYVLTWVAFKYASHKMPKPLLTGFLRDTFDYAIAGVGGSPDNGNHKARYLKAPDELKKAKFTSIRLFSLLTAITKKISTRYIDMDDDESEDLLQTWSDKNQNDSAAKGLHAEKLKELESSDWIIGLFERALKLDGWPENDAAKEHELDRDLEPRTTTMSSQKPIPKADNSEELVGVGEGERRHDDVGVNETNDDKEDEDEDEDEDDEDEDEDEDDEDEDEDEDEDDEDEDEDDEDEDEDEPPAKRLRL